MDANGILNVSAKDKGTGKEQSIRIEASTGLSDEEIQKMRAEAEANADSDAKAKEKVDKINGADTLIFQTEKQLKEFGEKIPAERKEAIETALAGLKTAHQSQDLDAIDKEMEVLNTAWQAASQDMYADTQGDAANAGDPGANAGGQEAGAEDGKEDVTDVEFEEVDDAK